MDNVSSHSNALECTEDKHDEYEDDEDGVDVEPHEDDAQDSPVQVLTTKQKNALSCFTIEEYEQHRFGLLGSINPKIEVKMSTILSAGLGVFLKDGCIFYDEEYVTEVAGNLLNKKQVKKLTPIEMLRVIQTNDGINLKCKKYSELTNEDGLGGIVNNSIADVCLSNCTLKRVGKRFFIMAKERRGYPLIGPLELLIDAGDEWKENLTYCKKMYGEKFLPYL